MCVILMISVCLIKEHLKIKYFIWIVTKWSIVTNLAIYYSVIIIYKYNVKDHYLVKYLPF